MQVRGKALGSLWFNLNIVMQYMKSTSKFTESIFYCMFHKGGIGKKELGMLTWIREKKYYLKNIIRIQLTQSILFSVILMFPDSKIQVIFYPLYPQGRWKIDMLHDQYRKSLSWGFTIFQVKMYLKGSFSPLLLTIPRGIRLY